MAEHFTELNSLYTFLEHNKAGISAIKVTSVNKGDFNDYEGYQYCIGIKVFTLPKFKNKQFMWETNSTYICDYLPDKPLTKKEEKRYIIEDLQYALASVLDE